MKIDKVANGAEYWMDEQFQKLENFGILIIFQTKKKIKILKVFNLENSQNFYFGKIAIFRIAMIDWFKKWSNIRNWSIRKVMNF